MRLAGVVVVAALGVRVARSRHRRSLHPAGHSFAGELEVWGLPERVGSTLVDEPGRHSATVRFSKGAGTRGDLPDVLGLAIRAGGRDLLLSTAGTGRLTRHLPAPRRTFDTRYGSIVPYRTGSGHSLYLAAGPDPEGVPFGRTLASVVAAAESDRAALLLYAGGEPFGRVSLGPVLSAEVDGELAFDPVRNAPADLRPALLATLRAVTYRVSRWWRGATVRVRES
ncbi:hypothetical protein [Actinoplanes sp. GCM10030250]|uniref:hypothetical protein n=1 Tax=Actinoplanes sp. GCM10030250 TaxID=3273376 RepID=UPI00360E724B